ncbi:MAG TPA: succinate dehydrogenase assembly factor 2 [Woeseiaceae bacterium]
MTAVNGPAHLRWQCRRGMRELDELLTGYLETRFAAAGETEQAAFRALLALPDSELIEYLLGSQTAADPALSHVIRQILLRTDDA